ncbi:purine permease 21-like [Cynara cardunculus var. scolymus]|uniref:purine permease 21-like n=1 Tax=Cynara cardunculus var. scolymus TaxID=59895 RepID=UPI000D62BC99|nr:purine permease 21-like [Cynara cardunculus var. scolymus]
MVEVDEEEPTSTHDGDRSTSEIQEGGTGSSRVVRYKWWMQMAAFTIFVLSGQSVATMLGRLYFNNGGNSKWMATLVQTAGFPITFPFIFFFSSSKTTPKTHQITSRKPSWIVIAALYMFLGIFLAADCMLYTIGLNFLPVSTFSLICASQLAFNAFFSHFLNRQKITPLITNSLVLLSFSSTLLVFQGDSEETAKTSKSKYIIGFVCTVAASAGFGLMLSVTQLSFQKILKSETYKVVFEMIVYQNLTASVVILVGLFASGEWKSIKGEMEDFKSGKVPYVMNLVWTAISWQVFSLGCVGLIFKVSSLFSNVISTLGIPIVPVFAVVFFHEKMNGVKVISMLLAIWGFISYIYQHYLDDLKEKAETKTENREVDLTETRISQ